MKQLFHIHNNLSGYSRAFVEPESIYEKIHLWFKGWRPFLNSSFAINTRLWTKPGKKCKKAWGR